MSKSFSSLNEEQINELSQNYSLELRSKINSYLFEKSKIRRKEILDEIDHEIHEIERSLSSNIETRVKYELYKRAKDIMLSWESRV